MNQLSRKEWISYPKAVFNFFTQLFSIGGIDKIRESEYHKATAQPGR